MPIRDTTIRSYGKPFIVFTETHTLRNAFKALQESGFAPNEAYLIVVGGAGTPEYYVRPFLQIIAFARLMDYDRLDTPLGSLPWPPASKVIPTDTQERVNDVLLWVQSNPSGKIVITHEDTVVGLFASADLSTSGYFDKYAISVLHGKWIDLTQEPRAVYEATSEKPRCPGCFNRNPFDYEISELVCPICGYRVKLL